jgi:hypothetical protein
MKKIVLFLTVIMTMLSCSKVGKGEFIITGTAKGIQNGKSVILQTQNEMGMPVALDTVKVKDGKFEIKGKITEPTFYMLSFPELNNGFPVIVENGEIEVEVNKDSIQNSKVSGTYNNDELAKVLPEVNKVEKKMQKLGMDFQAKNMEKIKAAETTKDTTLFNQLNKEFMAVMKPNSEYYFKYVEEHPKSFISILLFNKLMGFVKTDSTRVNKLYNDLDPELKKTKMGKQIGEALKKMANSTEDSKKKVTQ